MNTCVASEQTITHSAAASSLRAHLNPLTMLRRLWAQRNLTWQMAKRDIQARFRGTWLGLLWSGLEPLLLLTIYTFVFAIVFRLQWRPGVEETRGEFALTMFCGMLLFNLFSEAVSRAPQLVVANPNYVKKVVFPVETLVISALVAAVFKMFVGYAVWLAGWVIIKGAWPNWTLVYFPLMVFPVLLTTLGVSWILASLGVFIRDIGYAIGLMLQMLFFLTPVFYRMEAVPYPYRHAMELSPLAHAIEDVRTVMMWGGQPRWGVWAATVLASALVALVGYAFFMKSKRAFADVL